MSHLKKRRILRFCFFLISYQSFFFCNAEGLWVRSIPDVSPHTVVYGTWRNPLPRKIMIFSVTSTEFQEVQFHSIQNAKQVERMIHKPWPLGMEKDGFWVLQPGKDHLMLLNKKGPLPEKIDLFWDLGIDGIHRERVPVMKN